MARIPAGARRIILIRLRAAKQEQKKNIRRHAKPRTGRGVSPRTVTARVLVEPDHAIDEPELAEQADRQAEQRRPGIEHGEAVSERHRTQGREAAQHQGHPPMPRRQRHLAPREPHPLAQHPLCGPGIERRGRRKRTRIHPGPDDQQPHQRQHPPADPHAAPDRQREQRQDRHPRLDAPRIGMARPTRLVHREELRGEPVERHRMHARATPAAPPPSPPPARDRR
jgi:hypothetical protein